jgi:hypothetical protein
MLSFSFAYDAKQDRIWLRLNNQEELIWLTRRLTVFLLTQAADRFAEAAGRGLGGLVNKDQAVELEHELAVTEPDEGSHGTPVQMGPSSLDEGLRSNGLLCERITLSSNDAGAQLQLLVVNEKRFINLSRAGFHRFLRALLLVANRVKWDLPPVPQWLTRNYLPSALRGVVDSAMNGVELSDDEGDDVPPTIPPKSASDPDGTGGSA